MKEIQHRPHYIHLYHLPTLLIKLQGITIRSRDFVPITITHRHFHFLFLKRSFQPFSIDRIQLRKLHPLQNCSISVFFFEKAFKMILNLPFHLFNALHISICTFQNRNSSLTLSIFDWIMKKPRIRISILLPKLPRLKF